MRFTSIWYRYVSDPKPRPAVAFDARIPSGTVVVSGSVTDQVTRPCP